MKFLIALIILVCSPAILLLAFAAVFIIAMILFILFCIPFYLILFISEIIETVITRKELIHECNKDD